MALLLIFTNFFMVIFTYEAIAKAYNIISELSYYELFVALTSAIICISNTIWLATNHSLNQVGFTFLLHVAIFAVNALLIKRFDKVSYERNEKPSLQIIKL
jgi:hypothetical protein